jgi:hypothetical protein
MTLIFHPITRQMMTDEYEALVKIMIGRRNLNYLQIKLAHYSSSTTDK